MIRDILDTRIILGIEEKDYSYILEGYRKICRTYNTYVSTQPLLDLADLSEDFILYDIFSIDSLSAFCQHVTAIIKRGGESAELMLNKYLPFYSHLSSEIAVSDGFFEYLYSDSSDESIKKYLLLISKTVSLRKLVFLPSSIKFPNLQCLIVNDLDINLTKLIPMLETQIAAPTHVIVNQLDRMHSGYRQDILRFIYGSSLLRNCGELDMEGSVPRVFELKYLFSNKYINQINKLELSYNGIMTDSYGDDSRLSKIFRGSKIKITDLYIEESGDEFSLKILNSCLKERLFKESLTYLHISDFKESTLPAQTIELLEKTNINKVFCFGKCIYKRYGRR